MKKLILTFVLLVSIAAHADKDDDPPLEPGEDAADFKKGHGAPPDNANSVYAPGVQIGYPVLAGTGCPNGSAVSVLSPENKTLSVLFSKYMVEAGNAAGTQRAIKNCMMKVPFVVPDGYQFSVVKLVYRGLNSVPAGGLTKIVTMYSMGRVKQNGKGGADGDNKKRFRRRAVFNGPLEDSFVLNANISDRTLWSACGGDVNLTIDTRVVAKSNAAGEDTLAVVDTMDAAHEDVQYELNWRKCKAKGGKPDKPGHGKGHGNGHDRDADDRQKHRKENERGHDRFD